MTYQVAALYIDPRGPYPGLAADCWDERRDARNYDGPLPVVAHPPCGPWGKLRHMYRGDQHDCAPAALEHVRRFGGVLEHPEWSLLFEWERAPRPGELPDEHGGFTVAVCQCDWGHVARKRSWIYCVGIDRAQLRFPERREPTHWISGGRGRTGKKRSTTPVPPGIKVCSAQQRRRTPPAFARWLCELAESAQVTA